MKAGATPGLPGPAGPAVPAEPPADALERLRDERQQIEGLFEALAAQRRQGDAAPAETARIAGLVFTLLRVHAQLESELLHPALVREAGADPALARGAAARAGTLDAITDAERIAVRDSHHAAAIAEVEAAAREWFSADEEAVFPLARLSLVDLRALDAEMAARQEALLSAGREL